MHFCRIFDKKVFPAKWSKKFLSNQCFSVVGRDFFVCYRKNFLLERVTSFLGKNMVTNRYFSQEEMSCHSMKFLATKKNCYRKKFLVTGRKSLSQELWGNFCELVFIKINIYLRKKCPVQVKISYNNIFFTGRKSLQRKKFVFLIEILSTGKNILQDKKSFTRRYCVA